MKKMIIAFMALATIILTSCGNPMITDTENDTVVVEIPSFKNFEVGDYDSLFSEVSVLSFESQEFLKGEEPSYTWESSIPEIATIDNNGSVTPLKGGTITISILLNNTVVDTIDLTFNDVRLIGKWSDGLATVEFKGNGNYVDWLGEISTWSTNNMILQRNGNPSESYEIIDNSHIKIEGISLTKI